MSTFTVSAFSLRSRSRALAALAFLGLLLGLAGCQGQKGDPGPAAAVQQPTGTIQGLIIDAVTQQPIVGAVVDIGVATASTNADGQFVFHNIVVPVDLNNNGPAPGYWATVNLRSVSSPVNMGSTTATPRYPDFHYDFIPVTFTPLYQSAPLASQVTATPETGLIANVTFMPGKLAATITGTVANSTTRQPVAAGYNVKLVSLSSNNSATGTGGTGNVENIVGSTTTDASGNFTFANVESLQNFRIDAWDSALTFKGSVAVAAPADGETKTLTIQANNTVFVTSTDILAPTIVSVTPEQNSDVAPAVATSVVFTFSEPIVQTPETSTSASVPTGLYNTVAVNFNGAKASNITRSLSWNTASTQLTVTIPTVAASTYSVSLAGTGTALKDANNNVVNNIAVAGKGVLSFTTNGSTTPAAPGTITVVNNASLDYLGVNPVLNWAPVSGAKAYNVYRAANYPGVPGQYQKLGAGVTTTLTSDYTDTAIAALGFVSGQNMLTYSYVVRSVSLDNVESADSTVVTVQDNVKPTAAIPLGLAATYTITFTEPVDEASAVTLANYALAIGAGASVPTVSSAVLNPGLMSVTLTLSASTVAGNILTITGVKDIAGNSMNGATRTF